MLGSQMDLNASDHIARVDTKILMSDRNSLSQDVRGQSQPTTVTVAGSDTVELKTAETQLLLLQPHDNCAREFSTVQTDLERLPSTQVETSNVLTSPKNASRASSSAVLAGDGCRVVVEDSTLCSDDVAALPRRSHVGGKSVSAVLALVAPIADPGNSGCDLASESPKDSPEIRSRVGVKSVAAYAPATESRDEVDGRQLVLGTEDAIMEVDDDSENDDNDHDSDISSDVSESGNLQDDLEELLGGDFAFDGKYAFSSLLPEAPNPGLCVDGLGLIGLPLSERDAQLIKATSVQSPFGHGERTVIDKQDMWEIDPGRVKFMNPAWQQYVDGHVVGEVWRTLGITAFKSFPKWELYKMSLCEAGSHFLPHQDTEKLNDVFATMVIILPSLYSGGQAHISHGTSTQTFDLASNSAFAISLLAWYTTGVMCEIKPITSGCRLMLSYNMIHTSTDLPPSLPDMENATSRIRRIFRKWQNDGYTTNRPLVAHLLAHEHSAHNLDATALKGEDAHKVVHIKDIAIEEDIVVCLAKLQYKVIGVADDSGDCGSNGWRKRIRCAYTCYRDFDSDGCTPYMLKQTDSKLSISDVVDLYGHDYLRHGTLSIEMEDLIPESPFDDIEPDEKEYEEYERGAGCLEYWYRRTVLLLFRREDEDSIFLEARGPSRALQRLEGVNEPTALDRKLVDYLMGHVASRINNVAQSMVDIAIRWSDIVLWKSILAKSGGDKDVVIVGKEKLAAGLKKFGLENVKAILTQISSECKTLKDRTELIESLRPEPSDPERQEVDNWCNEETSHALHSLKLPTTADVPILMAVVLQRGIQLFAEVILPQLSKFTSTFDFWMLFIRSLYSNANVLCAAAPESLPITHDQMPSQANTTSTNEDIFKKAIDQCIDMAILQWDNPSKFNNPASSNVKVDRIVKLIELCISIGHVDVCLQLLSLLLKDPKESLDVAVLELLAPALRRRIINTRGIDVCGGPWSHFLQLLVTVYMFHGLGTQPQVLRVPNVRKIGCGCPDCCQLDTFIASQAESQTYRFRESRRRHLEKRLKSAKDLVTYEIIDTESPHGLRVTKLGDIVAMAGWRSRQALAKKFLSHIGNDATIQKIMGSRYGDIGRAVNGTQQFQLSIDLATSGASSSTSITVSTSTAAVPAQATNRAPSIVPIPPVASRMVQPNSTIGSTSSSLLAVPMRKRKRKAATSTTGVIDLTY